MIRLLIYGGGQWEKVEGKFLLGSSDSYTVGSEGGEAEHTLTVSEMPSHSHFNNGTYVALSVSSASVSSPALSGGFGGDKGWWGDREKTEQAVYATGGSQPHNNLPPYRVVNIWKRTE